MLKLTRRVLELTLAVFVVGVLGFAVVAKAAPLAGYGLYAVRSASMAPAIGIGDLVVAQHVDPAAIEPGDVITVARGSGATVTHRVVGVAVDAQGAEFRTQGDANPSADPVATPAAEVRGRVAWELRLLGFLLAMVSMPSGLLALFSIGATLLTAAWLLDDLEAEAEAEAAAAAAAEHAEEQEELDRRARGLGGGQAVLP